MTADRLLSEGSGKTPNDPFIAPNGDAKSASALLAWAAGVTPISRAVPLYARMDLLAERDILKADLDSARVVEDSEAETRILANIRKINEQIEQSKMMVKVQQLSESKRREVVEELTAQGYENDTDEFLLRAAAEHIVEPAGMTYEVLAQLVEVIPLQVADIVLAVADMNEKTPDVRLTSPF